jgi:hypothetical protein
MEIQIPLGAAGAQIAYDAASAQTKSDHRSAEAASVESNHCNGAEANIAYVQLIFRQMEARGIEVPGQLRDLFEKYKTQFDTLQTQYMPTFLSGDGLNYQLLANDLEVLYDMSKTYLTEEKERIRRLAEERRRLAEEQRKLAEERRNEVQFFTQQLDFWEMRLASATDEESKDRCGTNVRVIMSKLSKLLEC